MIVSPIASFDKEGEFVKPKMMSPLLDFYQNCGYEDNVDYGCCKVGLEKTQKKDK